MRFLIDNALSPSVARILRDAGHDAVHVRDMGLQAARDTVVFWVAQEQDRILVSADADFGTLLAHWKDSKPSVILFRRGAESRPQQQAGLIPANLLAVRSELELNQVVYSVVCSREKRGSERYRALPFHEQDKQEGIRL